MLAVIMVVGASFMVLKTGFEGVTGFAVETPEKAKTKIENPTDPHEVLLKNKEPVKYDVENSIVKIGDTDITNTRISSLDKENKYALIEYNNNFYLKNLDKLPEGQSITNQIHMSTVNKNVIFGDNLVRPVDVEDYASADSVVWDGGTYTIKHKTDTGIIPIKQVNIKDPEKPTIKEIQVPSGSDMQTTVAKLKQLGLDYSYEQEKGVVTSQVEFQGSSAKTVKVDGSKTTTSYFTFEEGEAKPTNSVEKTCTPQGCDWTVKNILTGETDTVTRADTINKLNEYATENKLKQNSFEYGDAGAVSYQTTESEKITVTPTGSTNQVKVKVKNVEFEVVEQSSFFGAWSSTVFKSGKKTYTLETDAKTCNNDPPCLKGDKNTVIPVSEDLADMDFDDMVEHGQEGHKIGKGEPTENVKAQAAAYHSKLRSITSSKIQEILNGYLNYLLGPFSNGVPAAICGDSVYRDDTNWDNTVAFIPVPQSTWKSKMEKKINEDVRTVMVFGRAETLTEDLFRYEVTVKLIGDRSTGKWELYLYNTCDKKDSKDIWYDYGSIGYGSIYVQEYAGQQGNDMIFECNVDEFCKFDQVCIKIEGAGKYCNNLAHPPKDICH